MLIGRKLIDWDFFEFDWLFLVGAFDLGFFGIFGRVTVRIRGKLSYGKWRLSNGLFRKGQGRGPLVFYSLISNGFPSVGFLGVFMILLFSGDSKDLRKTVYQKMRGFEMCSF
jgi:hypothetical protein